jgi:peptidoglycan/LPS O-acetylase OafA/YrhL
MRFHAPLHGLRGIAVLYVVLSHLGNGGLYLLPIRHDAIGKVGVWIFFVLSAYLLTSKLTAAMEAEGAKATRPYAIHRLLRIYPLYAVVLGLHVLWSGFSVADYLRHAALLEGRWELWAIPVEFRFYAVLPVIAWCAARFGRRTGAALVGACGLASFVWGLSRPESVFSGELSLAPKFVPFACGPAAALSGIRAKAGVAIVCALSLGALTVACWQLFRGGWPVAAAPWVGAGLGIAVAALVVSAGRPLAWRPLVYIGEISFSLYLLHMFVIKYALTLHAPPVLIGWGALALSVALASLSYFLVELPGIRLGRRLTLRACDKATN